MPRDATVLFTNLSPINSRITVLQAQNITIDIEESKLFCPVTVVKNIRNNLQFRNVGYYGGGKKC